MVLGHLNKNDIVSSVLVAITKRDPNLHQNQGHLHYALL